MTDFPATLRRWRAHRRLSQLDLALEADVSARHVSFLETGRARPTREMVARLGTALGLPMAAENELLVQAGFAPRYVARDWEAAEMAPIRAAVDHMLAGHAPYPALAVDGLWRVVRFNGPAEKLYGALSVGIGDSLLDLICSDRLAPLVENWGELAHASAARLRVESAAAGGVAELDRAAAWLSAVPAPDAPPAGPVIPTVLRLGEMRLSLFATIAQFGTPEDLALCELKVEMFFPADAATEAALKQL